MMQGFAKEINRLFFFAPNEKIATKALRHKAAESFLDKGNKVAGSENIIAV